MPLEPFEYTLAGAAPKSPRILKGFATQTPCTTELGTLARLKPEFDKRGVKLIGISVDPVDRHEKWGQDIKETQGYAQA